MDMETRVEDAFPDYVVESNKTGPFFYIFVLAYTTFAFLLIAPLVKCSRSYEEKRLLENVQQTDPENPTDDKESQIDENVAPTTEDGAIPTSLSANRNNNTPPISESQAPTNNSKERSKSSAKSDSVSGGRGGLGLLLRELDKVAAEGGYPDCDPDFKSRISGSVQPPAETVTSKAPTEHSSGLPSAATTSRLHVAPSSRRLPSLILDVGGRRWKHRRPLGRVDVIQNAINNETNSTIMKRSAAISGKKRPRKGMSDLASSILQDQTQDMNSSFFNRASVLHRNRFQRSGAGSYSGTSGKSILSSIVDDISPNDAADANDPGRGNIFIPDSRAMQQKEGIFSLKLGCLSPIVAALLELGAPDEETIRVVRTSIPLSVGAMSEALFRLITASFISQYLGSESMIAYLLVGLFVRLTSEELSGAIIDALSSFVQASLFSGEGDVSYLAGQYVQLAVVLQLLLGVPLLLVWALTMESVVFWFVQSRSIAIIAEEYAKVVVFSYLVQAVSRTYTVVFHIVGHEHFESVVDFSASALQVILIACIVALFDNVTLTTVGRIQLLISVAAAVAKVTFPIMRGWLQPFRAGMMQNFAIIKNRTAFWHLSRATLPLLIGTILEYGEWEVLTIFIRHLGPAEVATWALLGTLWDVLESLTEGIGEAGGIQLVFLLAAGQPERAKKLSHTVIYIAVVQALLITSVLYMSGKYLAVLFSTDPTIQHMMNDSIALLGLANIAMAFSQVSWSLIGAQGRFRLATSVVFFSRWLITTPVALIAIFVFFLDLNSVNGALVVGYATASCVLTFIVLRSDFERLSRLMQEMNNPVQGGLEYLEDFDDELSDDDDDDDDESSSDDSSAQDLEKPPKGLRHRVPQESL